MSSGEEPQESKHGLLTTIGYQLGPQEAPQYALEGSIAIGGAGVSWLRDQMGLIDSAEESEAVAASVQDTAGAILVLLLHFCVIGLVGALSKGLLSRGLTRGHVIQKHIFFPYLDTVGQAVHEHDTAANKNVV